MTWDELRTYCLSLPEAVETFPFEPTVSVFKAPGGKMFAITTSPTDPVDVSVKCDPDIGEALRAEYESIVPGYHLNKRHWNTVLCDGGSVSDALVRDMVEDSYDLIVAAMPAAVRERLGWTVSA